MVELFIIMLERVGIIIAVAFIVTRLRFFQEMVHGDRLSREKEITAILFFGIFGIAGTYLGVAFDTNALHFNSVQVALTSNEAIANSRVIGVVIAGLLGGYRVGLGAGLIAGLHRFTLGGFTAISCGTATILSGILAALFRKKGKQIKLPAAFAIGALAEMLQMGIILLGSKPFEKALTLVEVIGMPMIIANGVGTAIFLLIVQSVVNEKEKADAQQAEKTLRIADQTLAYLRKGMNTTSAHAVCSILYEEIEASAVAMTNRTHILAHVGIASDHHQANHPILTDITEEVIRTGKLIIAKETTIHCKTENCPLGAAIVAPLKQRDQTVGTIKLYYRTDKEITDVSIELVTGLSALLGNQLEIAAADRAYQLAKEAEIEALQAQISPHFLFNSLNIIVSLIRTNPDKARALLVSLSYFIRQNLAGTTARLVSISQELAHVKAYLKIEEARFVDKLKIIYDIDEAVLGWNIPPLTLQPIVENAVRHGIKDMEMNSEVTISMQMEDQHITIKVTDNGKGIGQEKISRIGKERMDSSSTSGTGMGLYNVNRRLIMTYGEEAALMIKSQQAQGTAITFRLPKKVHIHE
ncbi:sensor histidine kinase [Virgibacillus sp. MG-45]|uniref:sensor histidine kinase n=1 Tax=Virgibacillus sp. MG-45 TaxID=3102791 RepID=UPI002ED87F07